LTYRPMFWTQAMKPLQNCRDAEILDLDVLWIWKRKLILTFEIELC
jgi:hypothetical protein